MQLNSKDKIIYRCADRSDNEALLLLNGMTPMSGRYSLLIDRRPDFFHLLEKRGKYTMLVAEKNNELIASCSITQMKVFVNKEPVDAYYVSDFRVHPDYYKTTLAARFGKFVYQKLQEFDAKLMFAAVVGGNKSVMPFLSGRWLFPDAFGESVLNVFQLIPFKCRVKSKKYHIDSQTNIDLESFRNSYLENFAFYTDIYKCDADKTSVLSALQNGKVVAAIALTDTESYKQEILKRAPKQLELLSKVVNFFNNIFPFVRLPRINDPVRILYIRFMSYSQGNEDALKLLISAARRYAYEREFHFLSVGIHDKSAYNHFFVQIPKFTFKMLMFFGSPHNHHSQFKDIIENGNVYWDFTV